MINECADIELARMYWMYVKVPEFGSDILLLAPRDSIIHATNTGYVTVLTYYYVYFLSYFYFRQQLHLKT